MYIFKCPAVTHSQQVLPLHVKKLQLRARHLGSDNAPSLCRILDCRPSLGTLKEAQHKLHKGREVAWGIVPAAAHLRSGRVSGVTDFWVPFTAVSLSGWCEAELDRWPGTAQGADCGAIPGQQRVVTDDIERTW
jgi:hypothetical protein